MFKWVSWVIKMGATALLLSFLCIWTTGYIVNSYMETIIKQLDLPIETQPFALTGVWGKLWGAEKIPQAAASASKPPTDTGNSSENSGNPDNPVTDPASSNPVQTPIDKSADHGIPEATPDKDTEVKPGEEASPSPSPDGKGNVDSAPVFNSQTEAGQLTDSERQALYSMVVSKLNQAQLKQLSDSLKGGLTAEELVQVQNMLKSSLTDQEYSQMMAMLQGSKKTETETLPE
ncbi:hypothetical protein [Cohnella silvisoli]|uniref:Spore coat protein n=1 Tax=Cohnella silvisoli TaxID=2873699 RepID=A0ABV1L171_9BACL|nr:hypothetical protein [Cohnella silvisoli]MCD9024825.1 hypothetical protein [Cohnella silvisoli]